MSECSNSNSYQDYVEKMKARTKALALRVIRLVDAFPKKEAARIIARQLLRSATSVGANYRAACRVRTRKEFAAKIRIVCEESDETQYWIELAMESGMVAAHRMEELYGEASELVAIFTKALDTARRKTRGRGL